LQGENASKLIEAYGEFLKDESEQKLNNSLENMDDLKKKIKLLYVDLTIKDNIYKILKEKKIETTGNTLYDTIITINNNFSLNKEKLLKKIKEGDLDLINDLSDITNITSKLNSISNAIKTEINKLSEDNSKKANKIEELEKSLKKLQENKSICMQKENIKKKLQHFQKKPIMIY